MREVHENRTAIRSAGVHRRCSCFPTIRRRRQTDSFCLTLYACAPRTRIQKEVSCQSEAARTQAKAQCQLNQRAVATATTSQIAPTTSPSTNQKTSIFLIARSDLSIDPRCSNGLIWGPHSRYPQRHSLIPGDASLPHAGHFIEAKVNTDYFGLGPRLPRHDLLDRFRFSFTLPVSSA